MTRRGAQARRRQLVLVLVLDGAAWPFDNETRTIDEYEYEYRCAEYEHEYGTPGRPMSVGDPV